MNLPGEHSLNPQALAGEARVEDRASAPLEWSGEACLGFRDLHCVERSLLQGRQWGKCMNMEL